MANVPMNPPKFLSRITSELVPSHQVSKDIPAVMHVVSKLQKLTSEFILFKYGDENEIAVTIGEVGERHTFCGFNEHLETESSRA